MASARGAATIDIATTRDLLHNGNREWLKRDKIVTVLQNDPVFAKSERDFLSRTDRYERALAMTNRIYELQERHRWSDADTSLAFASLDEQFPIGLHNVAFQPVFLSQGSPSLVAKYAPLITARGILGCYLQTELGHGTNVGQLETTATYDPVTREFEIHSPTLTSSKWWIGALGKTSTHGVVQAKLILPGGKDVGPHLFFVQLRSMGPKALAGYSPTDNGFARFDHIRIPKENMLSKFAQVTDEGEYVHPPHAKLSYGGMLYIRANMVTSAGWLMAKAATVSLRYSTVRRQGSKDAEGLEQQVINYPSVYIRLLPILSHAYVFIQLGRTLLTSFNTMSSRLASGDTSLLAELHATTSGLKVLVSALGVHDLEVARRAMGGHGYSAFAGLGRLYADYLPSVTYEGDNFVLDQQVVRAALKAHNALFASPSPTTPAPSLSPSSAYLRLLSSHTRPAAPASSWLDPRTSIVLLEWRAALLVQEHARTVTQLDASVYQRVAKAVTEAFVAVQVGAMIDGVGEAGLKGESAAVVRGVYILYLLTAVEAALVDLLSFGLLQPAYNVDQRGTESTDPARSLRLTIDAMCRTLLPNAIGLSDAFAFTDWELDSALGVYDGKVYDALWARAQTEPLNKKGVTDAYEESIRPMLQRGQRQVAASRGKAKL
ncbi:hypothetical protein DXG01_003724 [Tephrocybe rancida]|nr:hypothetical protein DXG01_003724 [Tephrocybe rancida]